MAANVATADPGTITRIIAGWPALALLIAVKLLSSMLEHRDGGDRPPAIAGPAGDTGRDGPGFERSKPVLVPHVPAGPGTYRTLRSDGVATLVTISQLAGPVQSEAGHPSRTVPALDDDTAALMPAARAAWDDLRRDGRPLTRDALAAGLRRAGHPVRNARLTPLLRVLREEAASPAA